MSEDFYRWAQITIALIAAIIAVWTILQKRAADNRNTWWNRMGWVLDHLSGESNVEKAIGFALLPAVIDSTLKTRVDMDLALKIDEFNKDLRDSLLGYPSRRPLTA